VEQKYEQQLFITQENLVGRFYHPFNYLFQVFYLKVTFQCSTLPQGVNNQQTYWFWTKTDRKYNWYNIDFSEWHYSEIRSYLGFFCKETSLAFLQHLTMTMVAMLSVYYLAKFYRSINHFSIQQWKWKQISVHYLAKFYRSINYFSLQQWKWKQISVHYLAKLYRSNKYFNIQLWQWYQCY